VELDEEVPIALDEPPAAIDPVRQRPPGRLAPYRPPKTRLRLALARGGRSILRSARNHDLDLPLMIWIKFNGPHPPGLP
jgi:hypothetical protein